jgi:hypothetical protein
MELPPTGFESAASASNYCIISMVEMRRRKLCKKMCKFRLFLRKSASAPIDRPEKLLHWFFGENRELERCGGLSGT